MDKKYFYMSFGDYGSNMKRILNRDFANNPTARLVRIGKNHIIRIKSGTPNDTVYSGNYANNLSELKAIYAENARRARR